jgi:hypothetical protein
MEGIFGIYLFQLGERDKCGRGHIFERVANEDPSMESLNVRGGTK